jgi:hypothetical protein
METHKCNAIGCESLIEKHCFMCRQHFKKVPYAMRNPVMRVFKEGGYNDKNKDDQYLRIAGKAISIVQLKEMGKIK